MTEEFALEELRRNGRAVHFYKGSGGEGALAMNVGCEQLFAGTGFTHEEHAGIGTGGYRGLLDDFEEYGAGADHFRTGSDNLAQLLILAAQGGVLERVFERDKDLVARERLFEEVEGAGACGFYGVRDGAVARDHNSGHGDIHFA